MNEDSLGFIEGVSKRVGDRRRALYDIGVLSRVFAIGKMYLSSSRTRMLVGGGRFEKQEGAEGAEGFSMYRPNLFSGAPDHSDSFFVVGRRGGGGRGGG